MYEIYEGFLENEVRVVINGKPIVVPADTTILEAAREHDIFIPTLCYLKGLMPTGACGVCAVEIKGLSRPRRACTVKCRDGMEIETESEMAVKERKTKLTEILKKHPNDCLTCQKTGGNCNLQEVAYLYGINPEVREVPKRGFDDSSPAMIRDMEKCIHCKRCITVCEQVQKIGIYEAVRENGDRYIRTKKGVKLSETACINCGQCVKVCPVAALTEKDGIAKALAALRDPAKKVVWQMAPAISQTLGEEFGLPSGTDVTKRIATAMKRLGDYAFTTDFSADVTIMEEGTEFIGRLKENGVFPMITSCCPGWIKFMEYHAPDLLPHLSSCKSPQQMFGALVKHYLPEKIGVEAKDIYHISIMPCVAKKFEYGREEMQSEDGLRDVDLVLTTREAAKLFRMRGIDLSDLEESEFDAFMGEGTGAARIFGTTGGVMEAALRTVAVLLTDGALDQIEYEAVRGYRGVKSAELTIAGTKVKIAVVNGIGNVRKVLEDIRSGKSEYHFIEVMACPGGCLNGGGAPLHKPADVALRMEGMYQSDAKNPLRRSHENEEVKALYKDFLGEPCGHSSHHLLHTHYVDRSDEVKV